MGHTRITTITVLAPFLGACAANGALDFAGQDAPSSASAFTERLVAEQDAQKAQESAGMVARIDPNTRIGLAPVIGASADLLPSLSEELTTRAAERGIPLTEGDGATYVMKGYFSTITDDTKTTVIYVWDILDGSGIRVHRIQGQQQVPQGNQGWASVNSQTMQIIADRTVEELSTWLATRYS